MCLTSLGSHDEGDLLVVISAASPIMGDRPEVE